MPQHSAAGRGRGGRGRGRGRGRGGRGRGRGRAPPAEGDAPDPYPRPLANVQATVWNDTLSYLQALPPPPNRKKSDGVKGINNGRLKRAAIENFLNIGAFSTATDGAVPADNMTITRIKNGDFARLNFQQIVYKAFLDNVGVKEVDAIGSRYSQCKHRAEAGVWSTLAELDQVIQRAEASDSTRNQPQKGMWIGEYQAFARAGIPLPRARSFDGTPLDGTPLDGTPIVV